jgi:hypothetical protein
MSGSSLPFMKGNLVSLHNLFREVIIESHNTLIRSLLAFPKKTRSNTLTGQMDSSGLLVKFPELAFRTGISRQFRQF